MIFLYCGCPADIFDLRWSSCRFRVCELGGAGTPRAAFFRLILGLSGPLGPTEVAQVALELRKANDFSVLWLRS